MAPPQIQSGLRTQAVSRLSSAARLISVDRVHVVRLPESRDFCLDRQPLLCRSGLFVHTDEIPCSDVIGCRQVTVIPFSRRKGAEGMVVFIPCHSARPVKCEGGSVDCTDTRGTNAKACSHIRYAVLYTVLPPHRDTLRLRAVDPAFHVQMFKHDDLRMVFHSERHDADCRFDLDGIVVVIHEPPETRIVIIPVPLRRPDHAEIRIQTVFFCRRIDKLSRGDTSSV